LISTARPHDWPTLWINLGLYQLGWFAIVLGMAHHRPWLGSSISITAIAIDLLLAPHAVRRSKMLVLAVIVGTLVESLNAALHVYDVTSGSWRGWASPPIVLLWAGFSTTFERSLRWISARYGLALAVGALAGPLAFFGGERLGAITLSRNPWLLAALATEWALALPLLVWCSDRLKRIA
jgi:hypothetical protein